MATIRVPVHPVVDEIDAINIADLARLHVANSRAARREEKAAICEHCPDPGVDFYDGRWLCRLCIRRMFARLRRTG